LKKKTIYIPIEWSNRELDSFIFFTNQTKKKKFKINIGSKRAIFYYIKTYIDENILSWYQEFFLRFAYPISVLVIIWFIKASW